MARLIDLLTFSGAAGDVVGCKGPHGFYIRSRPRKQRKAPTTKQLEVRARLGLAMGFLKPLKTVIYKGLSARYGAMSRVSAMNAAASHVLNHAITGEFPDLKIDPAEVRLSRGTLKSLPDAESRLSGASVEVTWSPEVPEFNGYADDCVTVVVYNPAEKTVMAGEAMRKAAAISVDVSDEPPGSELLVYACVADRDGKQFANSQYLGTVRKLV
ncbi:MAG TPA: DUF6266 family protein [Parapedobacter sp.]|nr:DUF6266 family protein [Parapedobacter sp.]